ncbi:response regulator receiver protein [Novosphingobium sp. PC22D]|uniref:response regulator receiver protein n=1 Tax=Novosphingobium sp. PC22D TaxID=1962403 RepID=UPI000BF139F0|nr:response regulator receiver protein [Novosphingobium sp. PC22D]PEQ11899.1 response regulator receiver protein [Novosphingobium sp. PC22D]
MERSGQTILLLEDEPLILMDLEFAAEELGCLPLCASDVERALSLIEGHPEVDAAVLDVSLKDRETCIPVARALQERGIPFLLHSGDLDRKDENVRELDAMLIAKPADAAEVIGASLRLTAQAAREDEEV